MSTQKTGDEDGRVPSARRAGQGDQLEAADYISSNLAPLTQMARRHRLETLGHLLDMARLEADEAIKLLRGR